jgi:hypothetical protein
MRTSNNLVLRQSLSLARGYSLAPLRGLPYTALPGVELHFEMTHYPKNREDEALAKIAGERT